MLIFNSLNVIDALGRVSFEHKYDLKPVTGEGEEEQGANVLWTEHIDSGEKTIIVDAMFRPVESRDQKQALTLNEYDELNRLIKFWARDNNNESVTLRQKFIYGDASNSNLSNPENTNHIGQLYQQFEDAGLIVFDAYDFKGNVLERNRQVIADSELTQNESFKVNWEGSGNQLDAKVYLSSIRYDALNRIKTYLYPEDDDDKRKELTPAYNRAGALQSVKLKDDIASSNITEFVKHIAYNAKGQRLLIAYGNKMMTRYTYNPYTFRLKRQQTERYQFSQQANEHLYESNGNILQNHAYAYDLVGNIVSIIHKENDSGYGGTPDKLEREFIYDALYRLNTATGRECNDVVVPPWDDKPKCTDSNNRRGYTQNYMYDKMGNILELQHVANGGSFTRTFNYATGKNMLDNVEIGSNTYTFDFDDSGNQIQENASRFFEWDYADQLKFFKIDDGSTVSIAEHYLYDAGGQRIKKYTRNQQGEVEVTVYIDEIFEHRYKKDSNDNVTAENNELHILDDTARIATLRVGNPFSGDTTPELVYNLEDHLGSSVMRLNDTNGSKIDKEEYYPFGESSLHSFSKKRYRFCGKEKDEHSGLYYYGARYYSAWMCRFVSVDPLAFEQPGMTPYHYTSNNPINRIDPDGMQDEGENGGDNLKAGDTILGEDGNMHELSFDTVEIIESKNVTGNNPPFNTEILNDAITESREIYNLRHELTLQIISELDLPDTFTTYPGSIYDYSQEDFLATYRIVFSITDISDLTDNNVETTFEELLINFTVDQIKSHIIEKIIDSASLMRYVNVLSYVLQPTQLGKSDYNTFREKIIQKALFKYFLNEAVNDDEIKESIMFPRLKESEVDNTRNSINIFVPRQTTFKFR